MPLFFNRGFFTIIYMKPHEVFFASASFFLLGVFLKSMEAGHFLFVAFVSFAGSFLILWFIKAERRFFVCALLSFFIFLGAFYYTLSGLNFRQTAPVFNREIEAPGVVVNNPIEKEGVLDFYLQSENEKHSKVLVRTFKYPSFEYGDKLRVKGEVEGAFSSGYGKYLSKEGVSGIMYFPEIEFLGSGHGSVIKRKLFSLRNKMHGVFKELLPSREAAFLNGITLGGYEGFSSEFKEAMSRSGTTHLVALSGYNITIIIVAFSALFLSLFSRRVSYILISLFILAFVLMTGAEASVVRAAVMGILVLLSYSARRAYDMKNALIFTALLMVLINPKVLVFDVGFQLSFLAVLGILYLKDPLWRITGIKREAGFLSWRDNLFTTASAQLAVAPILISNFGSFSPVSLLANVVILELIPITMFFGFLILFLSVFSYYLALVVSWLAETLLFMETHLIEIFAEISAPLEFSFGILGFIFYYLLLWLIIKKGNYRLTSY